MKCFNDFNTLFAAGTVTDNGVFRFFLEKCPLWRPLRKLHEFVWVCKGKNNDDSTDVSHVYFLQTVFKMRESVSYCYRYSCGEWGNLWDEAEKKLRKEGSRNALDPLLQKIERNHWISRANDLFQKTNFQTWLHWFIRFL